ncbi:MAG: beta-galactosidase [Planctomycetota bacterium]
MKKSIKISISILLVIGLTSCNAAETQNTSGWQQNLTSTIPYKIQKAHGVLAQSAEGRHTLRAKGGFKLTLVPAKGDVWNMESVSVLGLMLKNTGRTEMILDLMLGNAGATGWSNSALGRTIVKAGEEVPLGVALCRSADYSKTHPAYLRMSGKPNGSFRHWHTIDPSQVRNLVISCGRKGPYAFELAQMFPMQKMDETHTGDFPFIDKYGQYIHKEWPGKVHSDKKLCAGIAIEKKLEEELSEATGFTQYGGWKKGPKFEATGFFRTQKYQGRWWFVDPEGYLFWSYGANCVGVEFAGQTPTERDLSIFRNFPAKDDEAFGQFFTKLDVEDNFMLLEDIPHYDFTRANLYRKYGEDWAEKYIEQDIKRLKYCNLNTIGAWSDYEVAAQKQVPYTVMLHYEYAFAGKKLPDPFNPETRAGLRKAIQEYPVSFENDPWCLGAFVNNELHWQNDSRHMVAGILGYEEKNTEVKKVFRDWLKKRYATVTALNKAWKTPFKTWDDLLKATDKTMFKGAVPEDCSALATLFADAFFKMVKEELKDHSPNILYLGCRMNSGSSEAVKTLAKYADVISTNDYSYRPNPGKFGSTDKPVLITEFHFANISGNNLGSGLRSAQDAVQQGRLFRAYMAAAVNHPKIIGAHWFQWRDQNAAGRYDGENYDVGFFNVADIPNEDLIRAAEEYGRNLYNSIK